MSFMHPCSSVLLLQRGNSMAQEMGTGNPPGYTIGIWEVSAGCYLTGLKKLYCTQQNAMFL